MKTIKISIIFALAALLFASCANDASDSNTADSNAQNSSQSAVEYTLSFDVNVPEDTDEYYWQVGSYYTEAIEGSNFNPNLNASESVPPAVTATTDEELILPIIARY
ncbi:MAG: hypothetical protein IJ530_11455 [Treponema sp.]|uniref:hypothetical protein n=1 Tax=Treponema sp. TaxID=166 RepID=UPI0025EB55A9|nr:hypothetical protein [Treponema sp.]MBQ8680362.1 hypothetical protein [Treponema sp.]